MIIIIRPIKGYSPDARHLGVPRANQCPGPVEGHAVAGLARLLPLALLHGLCGLRGLVLSCK